MQCMILKPQVLMQCMILQPQVLHKNVLLLIGLGVNYELDPSKFKLTIFLSSF